MKIRRKNIWYPYRCMTAEIPLENGDRDTILQWLADTHLVEWYSTYLLDKKLEYMEDEVAEIWLILCEIPQDRWDNVYNQGKAAVSAYVTGIIHQQLISLTSTVFRKYGRYREKQVKQDENWWNNYGETTADNE